MEGLYPPGYEYPMPGMMPSYLDNTLAATLDDVTLYGEPMTVTPTPVGRNTIPYDDRRVCAGNTNCIPICPIQAKYDATVTINKALNTGNVTILYQSVASRVVVDPASGKISGIDYITWTDPRGGASGKGTAVGKFYVLAAHAIETPRLLLMSADRTVAQWRRQQQRSGRPQPDGPPALSELGADARGQARSTRCAGRSPPPGSRRCATPPTARTGRPSGSRSATKAGISRSAIRIRPRRTYIDGTNVSQLNPEGLKLHGNALIQTLNKLMIRQFRMANLVEQEADPRSRVIAVA